LTHIKAEPQQQPQYQQQYQQQQMQQQPMQMQPMCHESAWAAASPAITGLNVAAGGACAMSMSHAGFMLPAAAAGTQHFQQQQMPMPLPLPLQLLVAPQHQQASGQRASDLNMGPLPSPIDLFHGDHGLHADDLLIGTEDVFDERMLCTGHQHQHIPHAHGHAGAHMLHAMNAVQLVNHTFSRHHPAAAAGHMGHMQDAGAAPAGVAGPSSMQSAGAGAAVAGPHFSAVPGSMRDLGQHSTMQHHPGHAAGLAAAAAGRQQEEHPDASARQGAKRRRSSVNGGSTWSKKQRPSDGSLVEVYNARHGIDDCLHFWHHD
jgi:hypothetical protein